MVINDSLGKVLTQVHEPAHFFFVSDNAEKRLHTQTSHHVLVGEPSGSNRGRKKIMSVKCVKKLTNLVNLLWFIFSLSSIFSKEMCESNDNIGYVLKVKTKVLFKGFAYQCRHHQFASFYCASSGARREISIQLYLLVY